MIDIVIPTLMQCDEEIFEYSLREANASPAVNQIIIIDNSGTKHFKSNLNKVKSFGMRENIFVNAAWNIGVDLSQSEHVVIMNDDIACRRENYDFINEVLSASDCGLCSIKTNNINNLNEYLNDNNLNDTISTDENFGNSDNNKTGWFFGVKKSLWKNIPDSIKIIYGDDLIYLRIRKLGYKTKNITNTTIGHLGSKTINKIMDNIINQVNKDIVEFRNLKDYYLESN
jgi:hypothetical protein